MENLESKKCSIISILNMKGGVGKTTLACNISIELADKGNKVLVIDSDPQFNTTQTLFKYFHNNVKKYNELEEDMLTLRNIFADKCRKGMVKGKNIEDRDIIYKFENDHLTNGLDLIPGDLKLIVDINAQASDRLKSFFNRNNLREIYDYIIIDCPPTWGQLTNISLDISNYYLIPTKLDEFSTIGITLLADLVEEKVEANPNKLKCLGVVYMMLNETTADNGIALKHRPFKQEIESYFKKMSEKVISEVKQFDTVIYYKIPIATESVLYKTHSEEYPELYDRIHDLTNEIIYRIEGRKGMNNE
ncbi:chromosome partitioning protein ParA (plasmid) [Clostridium tetani]|uniref:ParA family protein n=1 Tax=Clostridium tetani TaxID=1513 RepID=UPI0029532DAA|nr:ParA family protein [Clostridium tetani]BDR71241.1 chromosome partitioning protein ParA [Clostridium tetani]BEV19120.1 AAA family ATPase [Clostridium tetani]